ALQHSCCFVYNLYLFAYQTYGDHRYLHSFPTRRSSDLKPLRAYLYPQGPTQAIYYDHDKFPSLKDNFIFGTYTGDIYGIHINERSEEHTSELQSREKLVCRLLLEKKKKIKRMKRQGKLD